MLRELLDVQGDGRGTRLLAQGMARALVHRTPASEIRKSEIRLSVAAIGRAQQRKQRLILVDGQELPVAESPAFRREVERKQPDFRQKRLSHMQRPPWRNWIHQFRRSSTSRNEIIFPAFPRFAADSFHEKR